MSVRVDDNVVIRHALSRAAGASADATVIANAAHTRWHDIAAQLEPVLGASGVQAMFARSLHMQGIALREAETMAVLPSHPAVFEALRGSLQTRTPADALDAAVGVFDCFCTLLSSLVGATLTARLLNSVWADGRPEQPDHETQP